METPPSKLVMHVSKPNIVGSPHESEHIVLNSLQELAPTVTGSGVEDDGNVVCGNVVCVVSDPGQQETSYKGFLLPAGL